jgi:hypothetical protein
MADTRRFVHDCDSCTFLGVYDCPEDKATYDLYHCMQGGPLDGIPTVIARYGHDGPDYLSGINMTLTPALVEAQKRAVARGLETRYPHERT